MATCNNCGNLLQPNALFCEECGKDVSEGEKKINGNKEKAIECPKCGKQSFLTEANVEIATSQAQMIKSKIIGVIAILVGLPVIYLGFSFFTVPGWSFPVIFITVGFGGYMCFWGWKKINPDIQKTQHFDIYKCTWCKTITKKNLSKQQN